MKRIAVLTSGGDAPGMNACIRSVVKAGQFHGLEVFGIVDGFDGLIRGDLKRLRYEDVNNVIQQGGTFLGSARSEEFRSSEGRQKAAYYLSENLIDGLIVIGGDGSFKGAALLGEEHGVNVVGIPGTIDNDIIGTEYTLGYDTALTTVVEAVDRIRDTASSHNRIFFIEVMGRDAGALALDAAIASGAEDVLIPEEATDIDQVVRSLKESNKGKRSSIVIVCEGDDAGGAAEIVSKVKPLMEGYDLRYTVLGHIQRGGRPSPKDRIIATQWGDYAVELLTKGKTNMMVGLSNGQLIAKSIAGKLENKVIIDKKLELLHRMQTRFNC